MASFGGHWTKGDFASGSGRAREAANAYRVKAGKAATALLDKNSAYASFLDVRRVWDGANSKQRSELARRFPGFAARLDPDAYGWRQRKNP